MLSLIFAGVSLFFIIIKGISLGDEKVAKWLTSLVSSFISSVLLTQPIQAFIISFVLVTIFRQSDEDKTADANKTIKDLVPDKHGQKEYDDLVYIKSL